MRSCMAAVALAAIALTLVGCDGAPPTPLPKGTNLPWSGLLRCGTFRR